MSFRRVIDRLRKAEQEIDAAKQELAVDEGTAAREREMADLELRLKRLEKTVTTIQGAAS